MRFVQHTCISHGEGPRLGRSCARQGIREREVCVYSISCKSQNNINLTLDWLTKHAKS